MGTAAVTTTIAPVVSPTALWFDLMDLSDAAEARRERAYRAHAEPCTACGRKVNAATAFQVHARTDGHLFRVDNDAANQSSDSQGWWPIGSECARRVPVAYKERATA